MGGAMPKGGARTRSGPAPDPNALRREGEWIELPQAGREGPAPEWPLATANAAERAMWDDLWSMPQALMWERFRQERQVALYVRRFLEATRRNSPANLSTLVRQLEDSLGISTPGMRSMRWKIVRDAAPSAGAARRASASGMRDRFTVVDGG